MSSSMRRTGVVVLGLAGLAALAFLQPAFGQVLRGRPLPIGGAVPAMPAPPIPGTDAQAPNEFAQGIQLPTDSKLKKRLEAAEDLIQDQSWGEAVRVLQGLLDIKEDVFVQVPHKDAQGKESLSWVSIRSQANRLLDEMPAQGKEHYQLSYGATARDLLNQARTNGDVGLLAQVAERYLYTDAGLEASNLLGTYHLDRGRFALAALYFERVLDRESIEKATPGTLVKAALTFHRMAVKGPDAGAGHYKDLEENAWKALEGKVGSSVRLGERNVSLADLRDEVQKYRDGSAEFSLYDWPMYRGNATRSAQGSGDKPFLQKRWFVPTITSDQGRRLIVDQAVKWSETHSQPVLPAFFPIAAGDKLIYRSFYGIHAIDFKTGKRAWEADTKGSLDKLLGDAGKAVYVNQWAQQFVQMGKPNLLFENSTVGTLSTDNEQVYTVDDLSVPPYAPNFGFNPGFGIPQPGISGPLNEAVSQSKLQAYNLKTGKLAWEIGGKGNGPGDKPDRKDPNDLTDTLFLGPPLPLHGKLYVLTEKQQELRLLCLDPSKGEVTWAQPLATTQTKLSQDVARRISAAHLAYGEGILVCPTNAGAILGVDLLSHSLVWAHAYRPKGQSAMDQQEMLRRGMIPPGYQGPANGNATEWKVTAPIIQDGKVIFTAPDGGDVRCLNLHDGSLVWQVNRSDDDLYLGGVVNGKVVVVGKKDCRALDLNNGKQLWRVATGLPSGQGVVSDNLYYLPLEHASQGKDPEVCTIDLDKGQVFAHTRARKYVNKEGKEVQEVPGNLLLYDGDVISQTVSEVAAFPQLKVKLAKIDELIQKNPEDPVGLYERGELFLDQGNLEAAVKDLRGALKNGPPEDLRDKARTKLYETLTEYLQRDFAHAEPYLEEYKALCSEGLKPEDQQRRTANYLCLVAAGREKQGRLTEAFQCYLDFGALSDKKELLSVVDEPSVSSPPDVWAQGRISAMMARATPEQREPLEKMISARWQDLAKTTDTEGLRKFVSMFGSEFKVGRQARLALAQRLMEENGTTGLLEAERQLLLLRRQQDDQQLAAQAVEMLARLLARKGLLEDAAHYYRVLAHDFARVEVRDGKTGEDLFNELATDKRFLPYLDEPDQGGGTGKWKAKVERGQFQQQQQIFTFEPAGEVLPFFRRHELALELNFHQLRLRDRQTGEDLWKPNLTRTNFQNFIWAGNQANPVRFPYYTVGHVIVLPLAHMVFGLDPINKQILWEKNLVGQNGTINFSNVIPDPRDGTLQIVYQDGYIQKLGTTGPIEASYVCLQTRDGLVALSPVTGQTLWTRSDVSSRSQVFGDDQNVYIVEMNPDGNPASTRALRAYDGVSVKDVPDFTAVYQQRQRVLRRHILASDTVNGKLVLRLYDVPTGKDVWKQEFRANSVVLHSEESRLAGAVDPEGKVTVVDLDSGKQVLDAKVDPKYLDKVQDIRLLEDRNHYYLAINGQPEAKAGVVGVAWSNLMPGSGLRSVPVNGPVYAFQRDTGKMMWRNDVPTQMLVLDRFGDLPVVLFTSRSQKMLAGGLGVMQSVAVKVMDKRTGKLLLDQTEDGNNTQQFYRLNTEPRTGRIELVSFNLKVSLYPEENAAVAEVGNKDKDPKQPSPTSLPPRP